MRGMIRARVITCSDGVATGARQDLSGPRVRDLLVKNGYAVDRIVVVPDDANEIALAIADAIDAEICLIATTGGTGIAPRDVTPEATMRVCDRVIPGFGELMRLRSLEKTPMAPLSRAQAATKGAALVLNLPGSPKGAEENLESVMHLIPHALELLTGQRVDRHP